MNCYSENDLFNGAESLIFEEYGEPDLPSMIILHGFFASSRNWRQLAKRYAEHFHVYALDLRNHGNSPHHSVMDYPSMAADVDLFIQQHRLIDPVIIGHSMGGKVGMWLALNRPELKMKLIVADISPVSYTHGFDSVIKALMAIPLNEIQSRKQAEDFLSAYIPELSFRQFLLQNLMLNNASYQWRIDLEIFLNNAVNIVEFPDNHKIASSQQPVLFVMGGKSSYLDEAAINKRFPNAQIKTLVDAGHWLHVEQADVFYHATVDYLINIV